MFFQKKIIIKTKTASKERFNLLQKHNYKSLKVINLLTITNKFNNKTEINHQEINFQQKRMFSIKNNIFDENQIL